LVGKRIGVAGDEPTCGQMADILSEALGEQVIYQEVTPAQYRSFGFPGADDLGNMFQFYRDFEEDCCEIRNVEFAGKLNPELQDFRTWVAANKDKLASE
ncbi:MAG: hypothetical protein R3301_14350, partial [Saprospiraceae bacterium]|nr:hypothetical protein [Saprospiraceae bacterium]